MRMVGNMSSSVDYRVKTILDAPGMEKGRVKLKKSDQEGGKRTEIFNNHTQGQSWEKSQNIHLINIRKE